MAPLFIEPDGVPGLPVPVDVLRDVFVVAEVVELVVGDMVDEVDGGIDDDGAPDEGMDDEGALDEGIAPISEPDMPDIPLLMLPAKPDVPPAGVEPAPLAVLPPLWARAIAGASATAVAITSLRIFLSCFQICSVQTVGAVGCS